MVESNRQPALDMAALLLLAVAVGITFGKAIDTPFFFDDETSIVRNESIRQLWPPTVPLNPPRHMPFSSRPLVNLSAAINYQLGGLNPAGYRLVNMAVHTLSAWLLFLLVRDTLRRLADSPAMPASVLTLLIAVLWAVHPLQTEAVCYVTQRTELIMGLCYLATLYFSMRYFVVQSAGDKRLWLVAAIAACLAGMASKEVMVSAPFAVLIYDRTFVSGSFVAALRRSWRLYLPLAATWILLGYLAAQAPHDNVAGFSVGTQPTVWWMTQVKVLAMYLRLAFWPWPLRIFYDMEAVTSLTQIGPQVLLVAVLIVATVYAFLRNWPSGALGAWFFMLLSPTLVIPILTEIAAERRMYLPLASVLILAIVGAARLLYRFYGNRPDAEITRLVTRSVSAIGLVLIIGAIAAARTRLNDYRTVVALWEADVVHQPESQFVRYNLAHALQRAGRTNEALVQLEALVRAGNTTSQVHELYGDALLAVGNRSDARRHFEHAVRLEPDSYRPRITLAQMLEEDGDLDAAIAQCLGVLKTYPDDVRVLFRLGNLYLSAKRPADAIAPLRHAVEVNPGDADAWNNLGSAFLRSGAARDAATSYAKVVELDPNSIIGHYNLAEARAAGNNQKQAVADAKRARELAIAQNDTGLLKIIDQWLSEHSAVESR